MNDAPTAVADTKTVAEDTTATGNVLTNDTDIDGDALVVTQFTVGGNTYAADSTASLPQGQLTLSSNGAFTFVPAANFNGAVPTVTYVASDGSLTSTSTLTITLTAVNDGPTVANDTFNADPAAPSSGNVLTNDTDVDGNALRVTSIVVGTTTYSVPTTGVRTVSFAGKGTLSIAANGTFTFTPVAGATGSLAPITVRVTDGLLTASSLLSIQLNDVPDAPTPVDDLVTVAEDTVATGNVLANDVDPDGDSLSVTGYRVDGTDYLAGATAVLAGKGSLRISANGDFTFTPLADFNGVVSVATYVVTDGGLNASGDLIITVTAVNDGPTVADDSATVAEDGSASGNVLTNDSDVDGNALRVSAVAVNGVTYTVANGSSRTISLPGVGTLVMNSNGGYVFTPAANYAGAVPSFSVSVTDGGAVATTTLAFSINGSQDAPLAVADTLTVVEDAVATGNVLANDADPDGDALTVASFTVAGSTYAAGDTATLADGSTLRVLASGAYTFTPSLNFNGTAPVATYVVTDGVRTATATLTVTFTAVDDAPVAVNDSYSGPQGSLLSGNVLANDADPEGSPLSVTSFNIGGVTYNMIYFSASATIPGVGSFQLFSDGRFTFTPLAGFVGQVPVITYTVLGGGKTSNAALALTVGEPV